MWECGPRSPQPAGRRWNKLGVPLVINTSAYRTAASPVIVWLRQDLRLADNPALQAACGCGGPVVPVFVWAPEEEGAWPPGSASRWWLHQSLAELAAEFRAAGAELVLRQGTSLAELLSVAKATEAKAVFWNRRYEPASIARDRKVEEALRAAGLQTESYNAALLHEPSTIQNKAGRPFRVFTPFWKTCLATAEPGRLRYFAGSYQQRAAWPDGPPSRRPVVRRGAVVDDGDAGSRGE